MLIRSIFLFMCISLFYVYPALSQDQNTAERSVIFLFDVSDSVKKDSRENYFRNFRMVLNKLSGGDDFVALKIGENSHLLKPIANGIFPIKEKGMASGYYENTRKKVVNGAIRQVGNFLNNTTDRKTSIISSFIAVNDYFLSNTGKKKYVFIFSDMIEESSYLDMKKTNKYPVRQYINLNPNNLKDAKVYIVGINTGEREFENVKKFWTSFIEQFKSKVVNCQYGLTNFSFK